MPADYETATREICRQFQMAWDAGADSNGIAVHWPNVRKDIPTARNTPDNATDSWARVTIQHDASRQTTVGHAAGSRRFRQRGLITVEIRVPTGRGHSLANKLLKIAADAYRGQTTDNGVSFFNITPREIGNEGPWYRVDLLARFQYDEVI